MKKGETEERSETTQKFLGADMVRGVGFEPTSGFFSSLLSRFLEYLLTRKAVEFVTVRRKVKVVKSLLKHGVELSDPDSVIVFLNTCGWENGTKNIALDAYRDYLDMLGLESVRLPRFRRVDKLPFIPLESEIDMVVAGVRIKMATVLQLLKETAFRPIEVWRLKWTSIDAPYKNVSTVPAKHSRPRRIRVSEQLLHMLFALPRKNTYVFSPSGNKDRLPKELEHFSRNYTKCRRRIADKLRNPRIKQISLRTFRHWKATMLYMETKDILYVKEFLGHVNINNTLKYVHIANAIVKNEDRYVCKVAKNLNQAQQLIELGFQYVTQIEQAHVFRKPK